MNIMVLEEGCANPMHQVAVVTTFFLVAPEYLWGLSMEFASCVILLVFKILRWLLVFWNICAPPSPRVRGYITLVLSVPYYILI